MSHVAVVIVAGPQELPLARPNRVVSVVVFVV